MAIQFACPGCSQPIEVDDEIAGKSAACPYCQQVVTVPIQTTYRADEAPVASPVQQELPPSGASSPRVAAPYSTPSLHVGPSPDARVRTARRLGDIALGCALLSAVLFIVASNQAAVLFEELGWTNDGDGLPTTQQFIEISTTPKAIQVGLMVCATFPLSAAGLILAILSLRRMSGGNWRGWMALLVSGGLIGVVVLGLVLQIMLGL